MVEPFSLVLHLGVSTMATKRKVCCSVQASNENLDPDLVDFQPTKKKKRFANPVCEEQVSSYAKGVINDNTHKSTKWAVNACFH